MTHRHFLMVTEGLPGPGYHGGAVASWAVLKAMVARGHRATLIGMVSAESPYAAHQEKQLQMIADLGVAVDLIDMDEGRQSNAGQPASRLGRFLRLFDFESNPVIQQFDGRARSTIEKYQYEGIYCYHFETVHALGAGPLAAPITVCAVDLYHLPSYFRWKEQPFSVRKYTKDLLVQWALTRAMKKFMVMLFKRCTVKIEFAPHYAAWFRRQNGCEDTLYVPTPVHDPVGDDWKNIRDTRRQEISPSIAKILMIGDIGGTATTSGLRLCRDGIFPVLEQELGLGGFEVHLVGGGTLAAEFESLLTRPYIKMRGRIVPPDDEFMTSDVVLVPTPHTLGVRVRIINAFSYGCCVVTHVGNQAGIPEMEDGVNSLIARDGKGLAQAIVRVLKTPGMSENIGDQARATFDRHFADGVAGVRVVKLMEQATEKWN